jgi:hypothetical protein
MAIGDNCNSVFSIPAGGWAGVTNVPAGETWLMTNISVDNWNVNKVPLSLGVNIANLGVNIAAAGSGLTYWNYVSCFNNSNIIYSIGNPGNSICYAKFNGVVVNDGINGVTPVQGLQTVPASGIMTVQPPAEQEWQIDAVFSDGVGLLYWSPDGVNIVALTANNWVSGLRLNIDNVDSLILKNQDTVNSHKMGYVGHVK